MYSVQVQWLNFNVNLDMVSAWVAGNAPANYVGCSADSCLTFWYSQPPESFQVATINTYWNGLASNSAEATGYVSRAQIADATATLKASCLGVAWDNMTAAQQKSVLGLPLTNSDLGL